MFALDSDSYSSVLFMQNGAQVVYSKYAGTEVEFNGTNHLILKEDDIVGILETDDIKDLKPLNDRVLIKVSINFHFTRIVNLLMESLVAV